MRTTGELFLEPSKEQGPGSGRGTSTGSTAEGSSQFLVLSGPQRGCVFWIRK